MRYNADEMEKLHDQDVAKMKAEQMAQRLAQTEGWSPLAGQLGHGGQLGGSLLQRMQMPGPKRNPELPTALTELNQLAVTLMNVLVDLEKRLQPVMRSVPPETQANGNVDQGSRTQLGSMVFQATHTIDQAVNRLRDLLDRLEL